MLQKAIESPRPEVRTGILVGSCCVSGDGFPSNPNHETLPTKGSISFSLLQHSRKWTSNSVGSPSCQGDGQYGPSAPQGSGTSLSHSRLA